MKDGERVEGGKGKGEQGTRLWSPAELSEVDISLAPHVQAKAAASALVAPLSSMS